MLLAKAVEIFESVKDNFGNEKDITLLISIIYYILKLSEIDPAALSEEVAKLTPIGGKAIMSTATRLREEGKLEGQHETALENARRMLELGSDIEFVKKVTGLSMEEIEGLRS